MTTYFTTQRILQLVAGASACLFALVVGLVIVGRSRVHYPDCPFTKLPAGSACVIPTMEVPPDSKQDEVKAYWAARKAVSEEMKKSGCEKDVTPEEAEALKSYSDRKYVRAREQSEELLKKNANSLAGMYVRSGALLEGEANPGKALRQLRVMRRQLELAGRKDPNDKAAREWYIRCVSLELQTLERLGEDRYALRCVDLLEQVFEPLPWKKTWPLLRLKEFAKAEAAIAATEQTGRFPQRVLNDRLSLESQFNLRADSYVTASKLISSLKPEDDQEVYLNNRALTAWAMFKFDEVESDLKASFKYEEKFSRGTAHTGLAELYLQQGRLTDVRESLLTAKKVRDGRDPSTWQFADGKRRAMLAKLLLVTGQSAEAERLARDFVERPDRLGNSSMGAKDQRFLADLLLYATLHDRIEVIREAEAIAADQPEQGNRRALEMELWLVGQRIQSGLEGRRAEIAFQPHADEMPTPWLAATLLDVLPPGVAQGLLNRAQAIDSDSGAAPYYLAHQAELDWRNGRYQRALETTQQALAKLPAEGEALLRTRLTAIAGDAARGLGRVEESRTHFNQVLNTQPGLLRSLGIALPVHVKHDGSELAKQIAQHLSRSPRFVERAEGCAVSVAVTEGRATCTLDLAAGPRKIEVAPAEKETLTLDQRACQAFCTTVFSAQLVLDDATINNISGSTGAVRERDAISKVLGDLNKKKT